MSTPSMPQDADEAVKRVKELSDRARLISELTWWRPGPGHPGEAFHPALIV